MASKYYDISGLPSGSASQTLTPGCLVLEGGALRGIYGAGVMDALMLEDINFSCVIGTSAGALNGVSYVTGQIGRSARIPLRYRHDPRYCGVRALLRNKSPFGFDFMFGELAGRLDPIDWERLNDPRRRFVAVAANCRTGRPEYFEKGVCGDICRAMRASGTMPYVSAMVEVDGIPCLDGGCCCKIPFQGALDSGFEHVVVVRTRHGGFRRDPRRGRLLPRLAYRNWPALAESLARSNADYNRQCDTLDALAEEGRIFQFVPSRAMDVGRMEGDLDRLAAWYWLGLEDARASMPALRAYLAEKAPGISLPKKS